MSDELSLIRGVMASNDILPQLIYADWLSERGDQPRTEADLRESRDRANLFSGNWYYGPNYGDGDGSGSGYGCGDGDGYGYGDGYGDGDDYGDGYSSGEKKHNVCRTAIQEDEEVKPGNCYLFFVGDGLAYVGEYVEPCGLGIHTIRRASNLCRTGGTSWFHLAKGNGRSTATVRVIEGDLTIRTPAAAIPWSGEPFLADQG